MKRKPRVAIDVFLILAATLKAQRPPDTAKGASGGSVRSATSLPDLPAKRCKTAFRNVPRCSAFHVITQAA
jgi:hypothetical protein